MKEFSPQVIKDFISNPLFDKKAILNKDLSWPKISIVTPSYNQAQFLEKTILSVLNQNYPNLEYIIIDGGSTDGSIDVIRKYSKYIGHWVSERDEGQGDALNKGFKRASGKLIGWLNSDDYLLPGAFEIILEAYSKGATADVYYGDYYFVDEADNIIRKRKETWFTPGLLLYIGCYIPSSGTFFNQSIFCEGYSISNDLNVAMDYELFMRLSKANKTVTHIRKYLSCFRRHGDNKSLNVINAIREEESVKLLYGPRIFKSNDMNIKFYRMMKYPYLAKRGIIKLLRGGYSWRDIGKLIEIFYKKVVNKSSQAKGASRKENIKGSAERLPD